MKIELLQDHAAMIICTGSIDRLGELKNVAKYWLDDNNLPTKVPIEESIKVRDRILKETVKESVQIAFAIELTKHILN